MRAYVFALAVLLLLVGPVYAQDVSVVFEGMPLKKVESSFDTTVSYNLDADESFEYQVRIVQRGSRYFWASREMKELIRSEGVTYVTFHAIDGSGYVRVFQPFMYDLLDRLPEEQEKKEIGYVEHLLLRFVSVTYYGNRMQSR